MTLPFVSAFGFRDGEMEAIRQKMSPWRIPITVPHNPDEVLAHHYALALFVHVGAHALLPVLRGMYARWPDTPVLVMAPDEYPYLGAGLHDRILDRHPEAIFSTQAQLSHRLQQLLPEPPDAPASHRERDQASIGDDDFGLL